MKKSFWDRVYDLKKSFNGDVKPQETVKLSTPTVKAALGIYLVQSIIIGLIWAIETGNIMPLIIPISSFLQIGWFWNKITDSWRHDLEGSDSLLVESEFPDPPNIIVQNDPITKKEDSQTLTISEN